MAETSFDAVSGSLNSNLIGYIGTTLIHTISSQNFSYTVPEDCWMACSARASTNNDGVVIKVDGVGVYSNGSSSFWIKTVVPVKKGQVITDNNKGPLEIQFYRYA